MNNPNSTTPETVISTAIASPSSNQSSKAVPTEPTVETHAGVIATWDNASKCVRCSFDVTTRPGRVRITQALDVAEKGIVEAANNVHEVVDFFAHVVDLANEETGELHAKIRLVMFLKNGERISTCSDSFIKTFALIASSQGAGPWEPPVLIKPMLRKSNATRQYATCVEVLPESDQTAQSNSKKSQR